MGMWGVRAFENDVALDALGTVVRGIKKMVTDDLKSTKSRSGCKTLTRPTIGYVEMLVALLKAIPSAQNCVLRSEVAEWRDQYFEWFDSVFVGATEKRVASKCRKSSETAFQKLLDLATDE